MIKSKVWRNSYFDKCPNEGHNCVKWWYLVTFRHILLSAGNKMYHFITRKKLMAWPGHRLVENTCPALCLLWFLFIDKSLYCHVSDPFYCSHYNWVIIRSNWQKLSNFLIINVLILSKYIRGFYYQEKLA